MPKAVKDKREVIREAVRRYKDPVERGAYVLGYMATAHPEREMRRLLLFVGPHLERAWAVWALKEGATQALRDIHEEVGLTPEDAREVYGLVDKGVLTVGEATLLLRVRKDPGFIEGRERAVRALMDKLRERPEA
jgi:hypothetical protein